MGQKLARNRSISYGFRDICDFLFSAKIQDGCQKLKKLKILIYAKEQKFDQNRFISYGFRDICDFLFSAKIQDGHQKLKKSKFGYLVTSII